MPPACDELDHDVPGRMIERRITIVDAADPVRSAVHVRLRCDLTTPMEEIHELLKAFHPAGSRLYLGNTFLAENGTFHECGLTDGDRLSIGAPIQPIAMDRRWGAHELRVVGGPEAGKVFPLESGCYDIGRSGSAIALSRDPLMSRHHLQICSSDERLTVMDLGSSNGTFLEGRQLEPKEHEPLKLGQVIQAGTTLLQVVEAVWPELEGRRQPDGHRWLPRRVRSGEEALAEEVVFPQAPKPGERPGLNLPLTIGPAALIGLTVLVLRSIPEKAVIFMLMGPIMGIGSTMWQRRQHDNRVVKEHEEFVNQAETARTRLLAERRKEADQMRVRILDPAAVVQCARASDRLMWARRGTDRDLLELRVGSGDRRSKIRAPNSVTDDPRLWRCPISVSLPSVGGIGIVGTIEEARGLARSLVLQAATLHSPAEMRLVVLSDTEGEASWGWVRWLPHARWSSDEPAVLVGSDPLSTMTRLEELRDVIRRRQQLDTRQDLVLPTIVVVYDGVARLIQLGFTEVLTHGPAVGVYAISVDATQVPKGCNASVTLGAEASDALVELVGEPIQRGVLVDTVGVEVCEMAARCQASLTLTGEDVAVELPGSLALLDVLGMPDPTAQQVADLWVRHSRTPGAPVGLTSSGPLMLDLTKNGPHGIVAGASRSGKSEFLKTFIASLAAWNHPDDLSVLIIDFKGGNDYEEAATLPHTVDVATQVDQAGFERSVALLEAEIQRRQQLAKTFHASTIEGYWAAQAAQPPGSSPILGRLVVIVDEFAELAQRSPRQLSRLVSVARVGAAYGVHLILATQRPGGVVSGQIDVNCPLRVCFRTTAKEHSSDIIGSPLAAEIAERHRGRGFLRAHQEAPVEFQCARVGNARVGSRAVERPSAASELWGSLGHLPPAEQNVGEVPDHETDFHALAQAIRQAAIDTGWRQNAVPWPKPLPTLIALEQLPNLDAEELDAGAIPFAIVEDPPNQAHLPAPLRLGEGHVAIAGSPGTGRSSALRAIGASAALQYSCRQLHLYAIDVSGGGLTGLAALHHVGGIASADATITGRVLDELDAAIRHRRVAFEARGTSDLRKYNALAGAEDALPWILFLIDGWEVLHEESQTTAGAAVHDRILRILREGQRFGLQAVVAGDRWAAIGRAGRVMGHRYILRFNAEGDYDAVGIRSPSVPDAMPPGRALGPHGRSYQLGVLGDGSGAGQADALRTIAAQTIERDASVPATRCPTRISSP